MPFTKEKSHDHQDQSHGCTSSIECAEEIPGASVVRLIDPLEAKDDNYGGIVVETRSLPTDSSKFVDSLKLSLERWRFEKKKGIWLKLPLENSNLVHPAIQEGFRYHHAEPTYVMLVTWISDQPCTIPPNASHQIGVGAFVVNDRNEILAVQENSGVFKGAGLWKMPTGTVNQMEDLHAGAVREVKEETGIDTEFRQVIGFRQSHNAAFGKSDLFFLCVLRPLSTSNIKQCHTELAGVKWMPLADFKDQQYLRERKLMKKMFDVCISTLKENHQGFGCENMQAGTNRKPQYFYYNNLLAQDSCSG